MLTKINKLISFKVSNFTPHPCKKESLKKSITLKYVLKNCPDIWFAVQ